MLFLCDHSIITSIYSYGVKCYSPGHAFKQNHSRHKFSKFTNEMHLINNLNRARLTYFDQKLKKKIPHW